MSKWVSKEGGIKDDTPQSKVTDEQGLVAAALPEF